MTLTETATFTKKLLILSAVLLVILIVGGFGYQAYRKYQLSQIPPVEEKPDVKWGILPKTNLPVSGVSSSNYSYTLDTTTGSVPKDLPKLIKVYFVPKLGTTLLSADKAKDLASSFKFTNGPQMLSETKYRFTDDTGGTFTVDLSSGNFKYKRVLATDSALLQDEFIADDSKISTDFKNFLNSKDLLKDQLKNGRSKVLYDKFPQTENLSATISLWQEDVDKLEIITDKFTTGLIKGVMTKFQNELQKFLELDYTFWQVDQTNFSTYPIKTGDVAFAELQAGQSAVVIEPLKPRVSITKVSLAYFLSEDYPQYLQPVYLFEGDHFAAMLPAIIDTYLQK